MGSLQISKYLKKKKECLVLGDFNFDICKEPNNPLRVAFEGLGFNQMVRMPTHYLGSTLDGIFKKGESLSTAKCLRLSIFFSDHDALVIHANKAVFS